MCCVKFISSFINFMYVKDKKKKCVYIIDIENMQKAL